jgi:hypothetical protein
VRAHPWAAALVLMAAVALAWELLVALVLPPYAYDALTYHLTTVASWVRGGNLHAPALSLCCAWYPDNAELVFAWPVLLLGSDALVGCVQVGFAVLGGLAVAGLARSAGLRPSAAAIAASAFLVTPIVLTQAPTEYADVLSAALVLAALHALVRFAITGGVSRLLVAGLAAGVVLGTKGTGIVWGCTLVVCGLVITVVRSRRTGLSGRRPGTASRRAGIAAVGFVAATLCLGSYWYARNWVDQGNPLYPFRVTVAGVSLWAGPFDVHSVLTEPSAGAGKPWPVSVIDSWASDLPFWRQGTYDYQQRRGGLGPLFAWLGLPLLVPIAIVLARRRDPVLIALILIAFVFVVQPYKWWSRFTIPLAAAGALAVAAAIAWAPRPWMRTVIAAASVLLALAGVGLSAHAVNPAGRAKSISVGRVLGLIPARMSEDTIGKLFFPEYRFLERVPARATIVVDLAAPAVRFTYPLFGPRLTRAVLPAGAGPPPAGAWIVTGAGRPLDRKLEQDARFREASDVRGLHVWAPLSAVAQTQ